jgi:hypothetical protein
MVEAPRAVVVSMVEVASTAEAGMAVADTDKLPF